ncbi:unnamed protein product [Soboliphyme baturini]|uniref:PPM-type phosphatase domain-containing protein n=1 Tax=Soboliphyme baturini TaxID=241478 RepID=A0A183J0L9_9BILA|nr:unnamed protein product [Soboliphyme baturini]
MILEDSSWIDDLPSCHLSGVGFVSNAMYRRDGQPSHEHNFEDACIRLRSASDISLYCVIDGHDGSQVAEYVAQKVPEELLLDQLDNVKADEEVSHIVFT